MKKILLLLCTAASCCRLEANPGIEGATVTLPYQELASLVNRVNSLERNSGNEVPKPPVSVIVHSAHYTLNCENPENPVLHTSFEVSNLSDSWQSVPLIHAGQPIRSIEPNTAKIVESEGWLQLLLEPESRSSVELSLMGTEPIPSRGGRTIAAFDAIPAARSSLSLRNCDDLSSVYVSGGIAANTGNTEYGLPPSGSSVRVKRHESSTVDSAQWNGSAQYLVSEAPGAIRIRCQLYLIAMDNGQTSKVELIIPVLANLLHAKSENLAESHSTRMTDDRQTVLLQWEDEEANFRRVELDYLVPIDFASDLWQIEGIALSQSARWTQSFYLLPFDGIDLSPIDGDWMETQKTPDWISQLTGSSAFRFIRQATKAPLELRSRSLPRLKTSEATVSVANYVTQLVAEGGMLHQASITVEHSGSASYRFSLPENSKLLSCSVNDQGTYPLLQNDGVLELKLQKPPAGSSSTKLHYTYTTSGDKLNPVEGKANLDLPLTPLFIHRLSWQVQLPSEYEATALEGNVVIEEGGDSGRSIRLGKQICHGETPYAALYYTHRDLDH